MILIVSSHPQDDCERYGMDQMLPLTSHSHLPLHLTVSADEAGCTIAELTQSWVGATDAALLWTHGGIWMDGKRVCDPSRLVLQGTTVSLHRPPNGQYDSLSIVPDDLCYEDEWLLILNKHAGWYTGATPWDIHGHTRAALERFLQKRDGIAPRLHLAHQLDRDTSGLLLLTKQPVANAPLQAAFATGTVHKLYYGVCQGRPEYPTFELRTGHGRSRGGFWRIYPLEQVGRVLPGGNRVRTAHTSFLVEMQYANAALMQAIPHTGRTHQIRLHLAELGHALLGDMRYGGPTTFCGHTLTGHLLHAAYLAFAHPITGCSLEFHAPLPAHIVAVLHGR